MARKNLNEVTESLEELVSVWGENKSAMDSYKKLVDSKAKKIKELMLNSNLTKKTSGKYTAKLTTRKSETFDEDGLAKYIKSTLWGDMGSMECPYIQRVEVINWDALEKAMYNGEITKEQVAEIGKYKQIKETVALSLEVSED